MTKLSRENRERVYSRKGQHGQRYTGMRGHEWEGMGEECRNGDGFTCAGLGLS
jgi:hypothetical protein